MNSKEKGAIFKIHRKSKDITIQEISEKTGIAFPRISEFENGKIALSDEIIAELYANIEMEYIMLPNANALMEKEVLSLYERIAYGDELSFIQMQALKKDVQCSTALIAWLLADLISYLYGDVNEYDERILEIIEKYRFFMSDVLRQIMYDCLGIYYYRKKAYQEARSYFDEGLKITVSDHVKAMILYHQSFILYRCGELTDALMAIHKAKKEFDKVLNFKGSYKCSIVLGECYSRLAHYDRAETIYLQCICAAKRLGLGTKEKTKVYQHLLWNHLLNRQYEKTLRVYETLDACYQNDVNISFYIACAYWELNEIEEAKNKVKDIIKSVSLTSWHHRLLIETLNSILLDKPLSIIERKLTKVIDVANKDMDYQVQVIALKLLIRYCDMNNEQEKVMTYQKKIIELLENRH